VFVTFEGPEGAGKSTAIREVAVRLRRSDRAVVETREPGATELGKQIRRMLLEGDQVVPQAELFLFLADRADHIARIVRPALAEGKVVLCDRHGDSTVAYQGHARGMNVDLLRELNILATGGLRPDLTLLFDLEPVVGLARITDKDRLDREPLAFHEAVRKGFLAERDHDPGRFVTIDAAAEPALIADWCTQQIISRVP